jgi:hypothetical protein
MITTTIDDTIVPIDITMRIRTGPGIVVTAGSIVIAVSGIGIARTHPSVDRPRRGVKRL